MAVENPSTATTTTADTPLIESLDKEDTNLSESLNRLETFLRFFGFCQYSYFSFTLSWVSFLVVGVALPVLTIRFTDCTTNCQKYEIKAFELQILVFQSLVAAISLVCISHNLRKYGVRKFLFVDRSHGHILQFSDEYLNRIHDFFRLLAKWIIPCFLLKIAREVAVFVHHDSWWKLVVTLLASMISWTYLTVVYLSGCALFSLVCTLLVIHFENFGKLLESDLDVSLCIEEHIRLTHCLSKISHRFRLFFILELLVVTASQFAALVQTTGNHGVITLVNGGDFAVSSIVELVGIIICLHAAARTSSRAQAVASVATRWHSLVTCASNGASLMGTRNASGSLEVINAAGTLPISCSESDLESVDYLALPVSTHMTSNVSSYDKRQAFVLYLMSNTGGFTVYGWRIDRALISTIFFLEMSLVFFVLGKTITLSTK